MPGTHLHNQLRTRTRIRIALRNAYDRQRSRYLAFSHQANLQALQGFCMFIGYPRSGHSLVGSLMSAHPECVISHELDVLWYIRNRFRRDQVLGLILERDRHFTRQGRQWTGYKYAVSGLSQGSFTTLRVIGDKKGGATTRQLRNDPTLLDRLRQEIGLPLHFIHIVRNPFDNISTIARRSRTQSLRDATDWYFTLADTNHRLLESGRIAQTEHLELHYEDLVSAPQEALVKLLQFVGLNPESHYLSVVGAAVDARGSRSRDAVEWPTELVAEVHQRMTEYQALSRYSFDD